MSTLKEDLVQLSEIATTCQHTVVPHMEIVAEQMAAAKVSGGPLVAMAELKDSAMVLAETLQKYREALETEGTEVGQAHGESPEAARSGDYYDDSDA